MTIPAIDKALKDKASRAPLWEIAFLLCNEPFALAGGCLVTDPPNDYDVYPMSTYAKAFDRRSIKAGLESLKKTHDCAVLFESRNALTVCVDGKHIQFCDYVVRSPSVPDKPSLVELVRSFDYTHVQVGVSFAPMDDGKGSIRTPEADLIYYTDDYLETLITKQTKYSGTEFPLGALIRLRKYDKRGLLPLSRYRQTVLDILADIINRGFVDYDDFKKQLESVDLRVLTKDESDSAWHLYKICCERGLVRNV